MLGCPAICWFIFICVLLRHWKVSMASLNDSWRSIFHHSVSLICYFGYTVLENCMISNCLHCFGCFFLWKTYMEECTLDHCGSYSLILEKWFEKVHVFTQTKQHFAHKTNIHIWNKGWGHNLYDVGIFSIPKVKLFAFNRRSLFKNHCCVCVVCAV